MLVLVFLGCVWSKRCMVGEVVMILGVGIAGKGGASELRYVEESAESDACRNLSREKRWGLIVDVAEGTSRFAEDMPSISDVGGSSITCTGTVSCIGISLLPATPPASSLGAASSRKDRAGSFSSCSNRRLNRSKGGMGTCVFSSADTDNLGWTSTILLCLLRLAGLVRSSFHFIV